MPMFYVEYVELLTEVTNVSYSYEDVGGGGGGAGEVLLSWPI